MHYIRLGRTGLNVSRICLGMMTYGTSQWRDWVHDETAAQIALAWMLHKPGISAPIIGASKMVHLEEAVAALDIELSAQEMAGLEEPYQPHPVLGHG